MTIDTETVPEQPSSGESSEFWNDNFSLFLVSMAALATFGILSIRKFKTDGLILVTVLSFICQFASFTWIEHGSVYATALSGKNIWLLAGLILQSLILLIAIGLMVLNDGPKNKDVFDPGQSTFSGRQ